MNKLRALQSVREYFEGTCLDSAAQNSIAGLLTFKRCSAHMRKKINLNPALRLSNLALEFIHFSELLTSKRLSMTKEKYLEYNIDVVDVEMPIFSGLGKMKEEHWYVTKVSSEFFNQEKQKMKV